MSLFTKKINIKKLCFIVSLCFLVNASCFANTASENAELARLIHLLDAMNPIINAAQAQRDPAQRIQFQYDWLRQDLANIRMGIVRKINLPTIEPRAIKPLKNDFLTQAGNPIDPSVPKGDQP